MSEAGALAAISSSLLMTIGFIVWDQNWKGSAFHLNLFKCTLASILFLVVAYFLSTPSRWARWDVAMLCISSFIGIVIGDLLWLQALSCIGARRVIVVDSIKPFLATILGAVFINENVKLPTLTGMFITVLGITIVALERSSEQSREPVVELNDTSHPTDTIEMSSSTSANIEPEGQHNPIDIERGLIQGYLFAAVNVAFDAVGSLLTKVYGITMSTWEINLIRFGFATICLVSIWYIAYAVVRCFSAAEIKFQRVAFSDNESASSSSERCDRSSSWQSVLFGSMYISPKMDYMQWHKVGVGVLFVTFACPTLANFALFRLDLGSCLTLTSLSPVFALPLVYLMKGEEVSLRGCLGAAISVLGIFIMSFDQ